MGLPRDAENMVILLFAEQTNRSFFLHGAPCDATLTNLPDRLELREQQLPQPAQWESAVARAGLLFGVTASPLLKASNVTALATGVQHKIGDARQACQTLPSALAGSPRQAGHCRSRDRSHADSRGHPGHA